MIITFLTVMFSSWRVSRLNIVAAIRDLPDLKVRRTRSRSTVVWGLVFLGALALAVMGWLNISALSFWIGTSMAIISAGLLARRFGVPERLAYSAAGLGLMTVCLGSFYLDNYIKRLAELGGGIEMFFLFGMILVTGAVWVAMYNAGSLITGIAALFRRSKTLAPGAQDRVRLSAGVPLPHGPHHGDVRARRLLARDDGRRLFLLHARTLPGSTSGRAATWCRRRRIRTMHHRISSAKVSC